MTAIDDTWRARLDVAIGALITASAAAFVLSLLLIYLIDAYGL